MSLSATAMQLASDREFCDRIRYHLAAAAIAVMNEDAEVNGHAIRVIYAQKVLDESANFRAAAVAVLTDASLASGIAAGGDDSGIPDADIPAVITSVYDALAGVST